MTILGRWFGTFFVAGAVALPLYLLGLALTNNWAPALVAAQQGYSLSLVTNLFVEVRLPDGRVLSPLWSLLALSLFCGLSGGALGLLLGALAAAWKRRR